MKGSLPGVSAGVGDGAGVASGVVVSPVPGVSVPGVSSGSGVGQVAGFSGSKFSYRGSFTGGQVEGSVMSKLLGS